MQRYAFEVIGHSTKASKAYIEKELTIDASSLDMKNTTLYFRLRMDSTTGEAIKISSISLTGNIYSPEEKSQTMFLMGVFGFYNEHSIKTIVEELRMQLNGENVNISTTTKKWDEFSWNFKGWYESKIKPCLVKEVELNKIYY